MVVEKYVLDALNASSLEVPDFSQAKYFEYRSKLLPMMPYLTEYIVDSVNGHHDTSYVGYAYFA